MKQLLIALDQLLNCLVWISGDGRGYADETLSARLFRCHLQDTLSDKPYRAIDALFFWQPAHCHKSWRNEFERRQLPGHYRAGEDTDNSGWCPVG